jgi:peroxiredoxin
MDDPEDQAIALKVAKEYSFPMAFRKEANYKALGRIWRMPSTFVIDKNGILRKNGSKGVPMITQDDLDTQVTPLLQ